LVYLRLDAVGGWMFPTFGVNELGKKIKVKIVHAVTVFFTLAAAN
jgi:hypothetical protein